MKKLQYNFFIAFHWNYQVYFGIILLVANTSPVFTLAPPCQWKHNSSSAADSRPVVDVVVDPHLSRHLRPHQRHGVAFLYQCVMGFRGELGRGAVLADQMGLGKTLQCIALIWWVARCG